MGIPLRIVEPFPPEHGAREPGLMWRYPPGDADGIECWWIVLPDTSPEPSPYREISWRTTDRASEPPHGRWTVTGSPPNITVAPSIDVHRYRIENGQSVRDGSYWHGFITNGELVG